MKLIEQLNQLKRLDALIRRKGTGRPIDLARKFDVSERTIYNYLAVLKELGAEIEYCSIRGSYFYSTTNHQLHFGFLKPDSKGMSGPAGGGDSLQKNCSEGVYFRKVATEGVAENL